MSIVEGNIHTFFQELLLDAAKGQHAEVSLHVLSYVTDMLVEFQQSARFFHGTEARMPVLVDLLTDALEANDHRRISLIRHMGDTSLMLSGYFPAAISKHGMNIKYYQHMGEIAYAQLGALSEDYNVFDELSDQFVLLSDLVNEVSEQTQSSHDSLLKLLEKYWTTGSEKAFEKLKQQGIVPLKKR